MWIKQRNAACEALLTRWAEPTSAWAWLVGAAYPTGLLRVAWKYLLWNHPHDSICGCSIDQVHEEMRPRFDQCDQIGETLTAEALAQLASQVDTQAAAIPGAVPIVVFNPGPGPRTDLVTCELELPTGAIEVVDDAGRPIHFEIRRTWRKELAAQEVAKGLVVSMLGVVRGGRVENYAVTDVVFRMEPGGAVEEVEVTVTEQGEPNLAVVAAAIEHVTASARRDQLISFRIVAREVQQAEVALLVTDVPAMGGRTFYARPRQTSAMTPPSTPALRTEPHAIENEFYRVEAHVASGTLTVQDKQTGAEYSRLNLFQDGGDVGDLYNYAPPAADVMVANPRHRPEIALVRAGPAQATLRISMRYELPLHCAENRQARHYEMVECPIVTEVSLSPGVRRIDIRTTVTNLARDHRLRVLFPVPVLAEVSEAEGAFEVTRRPVRQPGPLPGEVPWSEWPELPVDTHPQKRFVDVSDGKIGLAVLNRGLPEYEVVPWPLNGGVAVALTLLRCVEWLSRSDMSTRKGHAGPMEYTPLGQCLGEHVFEYALAPHAGPWHAEDAMPLSEAQAFETGLRARVTGLHAGKLPTSWSFVTVAPAGVVLSAIKRAERENALVVRLYNPLPRGVTAEVRVLFACREVQLATLKEEQLPDTEAAAHELTPLADQGARLAMRSSEIVTLLLRF